MISKKDIILKITHSINGINLMIDDLLKDKNMSYSELTYINDARTALNEAMEHFNKLKKF